MRLSQKYRYILKATGFVLLLVVMVVLNEHQQNHRHASADKATTTISQDTGNTGISPFAIQLPRESQGMLPLQLISKPNSLFLLVVKQGHEFAFQRKFKLQKAIYIQIGLKINPGAWIQVMVGSGNKKIR